MKNKPLRDKQICRFCGCKNTKEEPCHHQGTPTLYCCKTKDLKEHIERVEKRLKEEGHTTHSCPNDDEDYECHCTNEEVEDQNCYVIPKVKFKEIWKEEFGEFK